MLKAKKLAKEVLIRTVAYGTGLALIASIPFWSVIFGRGDMAE